MTQDFQPFANASSRRVGDLTIENSEDRVSLYGDIDLTRDKAGLAVARDLKAILDAVVANLSGDAGLPDAVASVPAERRPNPLL